MSATREQVEADWAAAAEALRRQGHAPLADQVQQFSRAMPPVRTDRERIAEGLLKILKARGLGRDADGKDPSQERSR